MAKRKGSSAPSCSRARKKVDREAREVENAKRMDKLPPEMWAKILDELKSDDLFPLALSCRYFRQKQKELVARTGQKKAKSGKSPLALKTNLYRKLKEGQPVSADYLRFCSKEKVSRDVGRQKAYHIRYLAAFHGYLPLLQPLAKSLRKTSSLGNIAWYAARGGQVETLQWLRTLEPFKLDEQLFSEACKSGHLEVVKWLRSEDCPWDAYMCAGAAEGGHLEVLKWLRSKGCPWSERACQYAAGGGHLDVLKWLRSEGCPWNEWACRGAAEGGHLKILKWLRSEGCPWDKWACTGAALGGHLEVLKWLRSEGCPWDEWACTNAAGGGHLDVLQWLIDNGCPYEVNIHTREALESLGLA